MEPRQKGVTTTSTPIWVKQVSEGYRPERGHIGITETSFARGNRSIALIDQISPNLGHRPNVLLVGLGLDAEPILHCYEPFRVAAHLEGRGIDYTMTLVDATQEVIDDIRSRSAIFLLGRKFGDGEARKILGNMWVKYLTDTRQRGRTTFEVLEGLNFPDFMFDPRAMVGAHSYLMDGVYVADVSMQFRQKLETGEINLIHQDIAVADIETRQPYDYVEFTNVAYLMSPEGQKMALANISRHMRAGGLMLVDDIGGYSGTPLLSRFKGWLDEEKLHDLSLIVDEVISAEKFSETFILKKVS